MSLSTDQIASYRELGHLTIDGVFDAGTMDAAVADAQAWADAQISRMSAADRDWYLERDLNAAWVPRKLDNPVALRPLFRDLASRPELTVMVRQLIGGDLKVCFSQIFFKPPGGGGPKPMHQDNYYFGPDDREAMVTAWIALDDADAANGCLHFSEGSNRGPVLPHAAPPERPFDLQIPAEVGRTIEMTPAPVRRGGVSFHHGNTVHQSSDNRSERWRRACAMHYMSGRAVFATPALTYDDDMIVAIGPTVAGELA